ncbi:TraR/DksA family transcriptional regulator [Nocardioides aequoreus]|uniref:TraR/DksA family transcriptional regulator n=1 Tax=Nocardioides aequoreus TaxID=397278 RepID=UPI00068A8EC7|nr:TraR/DksA C4-type zinc finger protein [Nocardioides aequoreus]
MTTHISSALPGRADPAARQPQHAPGTQHRSPGLSAASAAVDARLRELAADREDQLASLPAADLDVVAAAHRASIERILVEVSEARARLRHGTYGLCVDCHGTIPRPRLELRPYAARCATCASQR